MIYRDAGLSTIYKQFNPKFTGDFLNDGTPPNLFSLGETRAYLAWTNPKNYKLGPGVSISQALINEASVVPEASAALAIVLLHEQAHFENDQTPKPLAYISNNFYDAGGALAPIPKELGNIVENVITGGKFAGGGSVAKYNYDTNQVTLMSLNALVETKAEQIKVLQRSAKKLVGYFGALDIDARIYQATPKPHKINIDVQTGRAVKK